MPEKNLSLFLILEKRKQWSSKVFKNTSIIPPETGMAHQVNLEYLSRVVFDVKDFLYPDSVVGTDSHTTMVNGLGILGWGKYANSNLTAV